MFHADERQARASLRSLEPIDAELLLPGHGPTWRGTPTDAVARAMEG